MPSNPVRKIISESQCGFKPIRGTTDMTFCVKQTHEKCNEQQRPIRMKFYDLEKAFDSVKWSAM